MKRRIRRVNEESCGRNNVCRKIMCHAFIKLHMPHLRNFTLKGVRDGFSVSSTDSQMKSPLRSIDWLQKAFANTASWRKVRGDKLDNDFQLLLKLKLMKCVKLSENRFV